jgi:hypothetical protein
MASRRERERRGSRHGVRPVVVGGPQREATTARWGSGPGAPWRIPRVVATPGVTGSTHGSRLAGAFIARWRGRTARGTFRRASADTGWIPGRAGHQGSAHGLARPDGFSAARAVFRIRARVAPPQGRPCPTPSGPRPAGKGGVAPGSLEWTGLRPGGTHERPGDEAHRGGGPRPLQGARGTRAPQA